MPVAIIAQVKQYFIDELSFIRRFFEQHAFVYHYFSSREVAKDSEYFLRSKLQPFPNNISSGFMLNDGFSTQQDYLFAKFKALERLRLYIVARVNEMDIKPGTEHGLKFSAPKSLVWTGEKIELVELAYGLYFMKSLNGGKADLADIVSWLEQGLQIELGYVYRKFLDISRRKNLSFTRYLDEMRERICTHILGQGGLKPMD